MNYILIFSVIAVTLFRSVAKKQYNIKTDNKGAYIFNSVNTFFAALFFLITDSNGFEMEFAVVPYIIGFAITFGLGTLFEFLAIREGSLSLTALIGSYSLMVPTLYGLLFLNESISLCFILGIILLLISLFLVNNKKGDNKISLKWVIYVALCFLGTGFCSTIQTAQQRRFNGSYKSEFMIITLVLLSIFFLVLSLNQEKGEIKFCLKRAVIPTVFTGIATGLINLLTMVLVSRGMAASIMFPVISGGTIIITTLVSIFVYKEKLTLNQYIGLVLGTISVVLMNI